MIGRTAALALVGVMVVGAVAPVWAAEAPAEEVTDWRSLAPPDLAWLARNLSGDEPAVVEARALLAEHITRTYAADATAAASVSCGDWKCFVECLAEDLSAETRAVWAAQIVTAYAADQAAVSSLEPGRVVDLIQALQRLDATPDALTLTERGLAGVTWKPGDLAWLAETLTGFGKAGKAVRLQLAQAVLARHLAGVAETRSVSCSDWRRLAGSVGRDLPYETQTGWAAKLREAFDAGTLAALDFGQLWDLADALNGLGDFLGNDVFLPYVAASAEWRSFEPKKLGSLAWRLGGVGDVGVKAQLALAQHVMATYLTDAATVKAVDLETWRGLTQMGKHLPDDTRQAWAVAIKTAFAPDDAALLATEAADVSRLCDAVDPLDRGQAAALAWAWVKGSNLVKDTNKADLLQVVYRAFGYQGAPREERCAMLESFEGTFEPQDRQPEEFRQCVDIMCLWNSVEHYAKVREWTTKAYQCALGSEDARARVSVPMLGQLAHWHYHATMTGPGKAYPAFAQALARHAREGTLVATEPETLASMLGTPEMRQLLRNDLVDPSGAPRPQPAMILAHAYQQVGELAAWRESVEREVAATQGDTKALWLVVRAYAESVLSTPPAPLRGRQWLDQSLEVAASEPVRLQTLALLARGYAFIAHYDEALALLDSQSGRFQGAEAKESIDGLRCEVHETRARADLEARQAQVRAAALHNEELRRRLEAARARGDADEIARYERLLEEKK